MKMIQMFLACVLVLASCIKEEAPDTQATPEGKQMPIRVSMPEDPYGTKVAFTADGSKLKLAWQADDCIRVISGDNSSVFTVSSIISDHEAEFTGTAVPGSSFDILIPGL